MYPITRNLHNNNKMAMLSALSINLNQLSYLYAIYQKCKKIYF